MGKDVTNCSEFQNDVEKYLVRHYSILDVLSKFQETNSRVNRAVAKAVTDCGCVSVEASKQDVPNDCSYTDIKEHLKSHLLGELCEGCQEILEVEVGQNLFYIAALCNALGLDMEKILKEEAKRVSTLGMYHLR